MTPTKLLVANRGEIACRVMRTATRLGWRTVAVYSDADADAPHVRIADEAVCIGAAPAAASYLDIAAVMDAARRTGADAVHPGYGFLSERADFADACRAAGLVFVGPPAAAMRAMGDKAAAKRLMVAAGVPCAPGFLGDRDPDSDGDGAGPDDDTLVAEASRLGLPLLVKAVAGGGGRGMRLVRTSGDLPAAIAGARREAVAAFGDGRLMLESLIDDGRHIEVQVFADDHGNVVHLGERDCTSQRRRQKLVEESPAPAISADQREAMGRDAVAAARAVGYRGAGTVEFIVDARGRHHFLEMNTRLQVEHPVTECLTGIDLVEWQLRIAAGEALPLAQHQIVIDGHAIEARLIAEDPYAGWTPQTGRVTGWRPDRAGIRVDHGVEAGTVIGPHYDAMVAKFVAHGRTRSDALRRLVRAIDESPLFGVRNNGRFLRDLLLDRRFAAGELTTTSIDDWAAAGDAMLQRPPVPEFAWRVAAAVLSGGPPALRSGAVAGYDLTLVCNGEQRTLRAPPDGIDALAVVDATLRCRVDGIDRRWPCAVSADCVEFAVDGDVLAFAEPAPRSRATSPDDPARAGATVAGTVVQVAVAVGDSVVAGQALVCIEAMKMEMWLIAAAAGTVVAVDTAVGRSVAAGQRLVQLEVTR